jgi:hypothetical protein
VQAGIATAIIGILLYSLSGIPEETAPKLPAVSPGTTPEMNALRIVLISKNTEEPIALELDMNVREQKDGYQYYHYGEFVIGTRAYREYTSGIDTTLELKPHGFIHDLSTTRTEDLSARYSLHVRATIEGQELQADITNLNGDFLVKNTPLYFKEISIGTATLSVNGSPVEAYAFVSPMYSHDYTKQVYFEGFNDVRGMARQFVVFDTLGNAYVVDRSDVLNPVPAYTSHQWVLYKKNTGATHKGFTATVTPQNSPESSWEVHAPEQAFTLRLNSLTEYKGKLRGKTVRGSVQTPEGAVLPVNGIAHIETL